MNLITKEEFRNKLYEKNRKYREGEINVDWESYCYSTDKLLCTCLVNKNHSGYYKASTLLFYPESGCKECSKLVTSKKISQKKSLSPTEFKTRLLDKNKHFINGEIEIDWKSYINNTKKTVKCHCLVDDNIWYPIPSDLLMGKGCRKCAERKRFDQLKNNSEDFKKILSKKNSQYINKTLDVNLDDYYNNRSRIKTTCLIHNYTWNPTAYVLSNNKGCPICSNQKIVNGINDIASTRPDLVKYFKNINDVFCYVEGSNKIRAMKCPTCGCEKNMRIVNLSKRGFSCNRCSDGISYPEKFLTQVLIQLNISFIFQLSKSTFIWCGKYRYDFYLPDYNMIIETHGSQHYEQDSFRIQGSRTLEEEQKNDKLKQELAIKNGIKYYIILDCRKSELEWIKNSIASENLLEILGNKDIDWNLCDLSASNSYLIKACKLKHDNPDMFTSEIANRLHLSQVTITKYLKKGNKFGLCNYNVQEEQDRNNKSDIRKKRNNTSIKVVCLNTDYAPIAVYNSMSLFGYINNIDPKLASTHISACCKGKQKTAYNYKWIYLDEYMSKYNNFNYNDILIKEVI